MGKYGTPFTESEIMLAAGALDDETVADLVGGMLDGERRDLVNTRKRIISAVELHGLINRMNEDGHLG